LGKFRLGSGITVKPKYLRRMADLDSIYVLPLDDPPPARNVDLKLLRCKPLQLGLEPF